MTTLYDLLRIQSNASDEQIRVNYRILAKEVHPDHSAHPDGGQRFKNLKHAYDILSDPTKRAEYDARIKTERASRAKTSRASDPSGRGGGSRGPFTSRTSPRHPARGSPEESEAQQRVLALVLSALSDTRPHSRDDLIRDAARRLGLGPQRTRKLVNRAIAGQIREGVLARDAQWKQIWKVVKAGGS